MKKEYILKSNEEFNKIINKIKPIKYKEFIIYINKTNNSNYKFGISVGKKIGKAVVRNKIKRQIRNIISKNNYLNGFECVIVVNKYIINTTYDQMSENLNYILSKFNLKKEK